jgi:hypothetical protein
MPGSMPLQTGEHMTRLKILCWNYPCRGLETAAQFLALVLVLCLMFDPSLSKLGVYYLSFLP